MSKFKPSLTALVCILAAYLSACGPSDPIADAQAKRKAGDIEGALSALQALLEERPDDPEVNYHYGRLLSRQGQPAHASWALRKALQDEEWVVRAGMELAHGSLVTQQHDAAIEAMDLVLEKEPDNTEALLLRARAHFESRQGYEESLADAERVLELDPDDRSAYVWKAVNLMFLERLDEAEEMIDTIEQRYAEADAPLEQTLFFCAGRAGFAAAKEENELADERFQECLALDPTHRMVIDQAIEFYEAQNQPEKVLEIFRTAHEADPINGGFRSPLAGALNQSGETDEAEALLLEGTELEHAGAAVNSWMDLALFYSEREDYSAAASAVKGAMDRMEAIGRALDPLVVFNYADMLLLAERYDEANAVAKTMGLPQFRHYVEGRVLLEQGDPAAALEHFEIVLLNWPNNAASRYYAAQASEEVGDFEGAIEGYRYAIRAGKDETDAQLRLGQLHAAAGEYARANSALAAGSGNAAIRLELVMEGMRVVGLLASREEITRRLGAHRGKPTAGLALVALADGLHERLGAEAALEMLSGRPVDLTHPGSLKLLNAIAFYYAELGRHDEALARTSAALAAHPDFAPYHEAHARALTAAGSPNAKAAYERAAELLPGDARVLEGQARRAARDGDAEAALAFYAQAAEADEDWPDPVRGAAELLLSLNRNAEAEAQLDALIERDPYSVWAPMQLAELLLARDADPERSLALARRAVYFRGGEEAAKLLVRAGGEAPVAAAAPAS